mmetsp:Transcript_60538/g.72790  ORF Transcript_60538/g.72790 Transcript_60538/m.72790 type:complete len:125 (+) Transcript_60538:1349-1723(+)
MLISPSPSALSCIPRDFAISFSVSFSTSCSSSFTILSNSFVIVSEHMWSVITNECPQKLEIFLRTCISLIAFFSSREQNGSSKNIIEGYDENKADEMCTSCCCPPDNVPNLCSKNSSISRVSIT